MVYGVAVEKPLLAAWSSLEALEQWVPAEVVAVALMSYLFIWLPLIIAYFL